MKSKTIPVLLLLLFTAPLHEVMADSGRSPDCLAILRTEGPRMVEPGVINGQTAELFDLEKGWLEIPAEECLAIVRRDKWIPRRASTRVHLDDGQVFPGTLISSDSEMIMIDHLWMRELEIPLERVIRIDFKPDMTIPDGDVDRIVLVNGDVLSGFIDQVGNPTIIETDTGQRIEIPAERVGAVALVNDVRPPSWPRIWTIDGLHMTVPNLGIDETGRLSLAPHPYMKGQYERMPRTNEIVAMVFQGDQFTSLTELPVETASIDPTRRTAVEPSKADESAPYGLTNLDIRGPARFTFSLPENSSRLRTTIERPRSSRNWSSPTVTISSGDQQLWSSVIESDHVIDVEIPDGSTTLVMEITCGVHGPIHCGVILREPLIMKR